MTEINIADLSNYDKDAVSTYLQICDETEYKIIIPRNRIQIEPARLTGAVEYDSAAYVGDLLSNIAAELAYYVSNWLKFGAGDPNAMLKL